MPAPALGASRGWLIRQAVVESCLLGAIGVLLRAALAWALVSVAPGRCCRATRCCSRCLNPLNLDARALVATLDLRCDGNARRPGSCPAWLCTDGASTPATRSGLSTAAAPKRAVRVRSRAGCWWWKWPSPGTLLVGASLLTRTFDEPRARRARGLVTVGVTTLWLSLGESAISKDPGARLALTRTLEEELRQLPGVRQVAWLDDAATQ